MNKLIKKNNNPLKKVLDTKKPTRKGTRHKYPIEKNNNLPEKIPDTNKAIKEGIRHKYTYQKEQQPIGKDTRYKQSH